MTTSGPKRLGLPLPAVVRADARGTPLSVDGRAVDAVRETWLVEDRWWTPEPLRRRYWEVVTTSGQCVVVFRELEDGRLGRRAGWYRQR
ncbi:hypothetical protein [Conexibacter sp. SYSU D00693]|uniref:hypothetical protein n=1 Tax=Conexibacter sp. SYSU D00693 TaxID=2812560 RepID=UPI00196ADA76|nr:hypothetical protein [Conexibacter sp. SYSU D00693]